MINVDFKIGLYSLMFPSKFYYAFRASLPPFLLFHLVISNLSTAFSVWLSSFHSSSRNLCVESVKAKLWQVIALIQFHHVAECYGGIVFVCLLRINAFSGDDPLRQPPPTPGSRCLVPGCES